MRFFKKIQDWILKSERIWKWILRFFTRQINPRSFGSWCVKGTEESTLEVDSSVPLKHHDPKDLGLICSVKKRKIYFWILSDLRIQSWIFLKKRTPSLSALQHFQSRTAKQSFLLKFVFFASSSINTLKHSEVKDCSKSISVKVYILLMSLVKITWFWLWELSSVSTTHPSLYSRNLSCLLGNVWNCTEKLYFNHLWEN